MNARWCRWMKGMALGVATICCAHAAEPKFADEAQALARYNAPSWRMIWREEFDKDGALDPAKWDFERGRIRNHEAQFYTDRLENARAESGQLVITARREPWQGADCTSASVTTRGKFSFTYGKLEIRAKIPTGRGTWPALWMLGSSIGKVRWPLCGEIDVMENVGFDPERLHFSVHTGAFNHVKKTQSTSIIAAPRVWEDWHVYGLVWTKERLEFFFDGRKVHEFVNDGGGADHWPFDAPCYLLMNLAIGGDWGGQKGIDEKIFPVDYHIDYVRVWQQ